MPWPSNKQSTIFISTLSYFEFLREWILSRRDDSRVWVLAFLCSARSRWRLNFFLLNRFLELLGTFSTHLFSKLCSTALVNWAKTTPDSSKMTLPLLNQRTDVYRVCTSNRLFDKYKPSFLLSLISISLRMKWEQCGSDKSLMDKNCPYE